MWAAGEAEPDQAHSHANLRRPSLPAAKTVAFIKANRWEKEARESKEAAQPRASRPNRELHQRQQENGRDAGRGQRRSTRRSSSRVPSESPSPARVSAALVAAHSPDFTRRLGTAFALTAARERGEGTIEEKYADAEEELLVLRQELRREREHGFREMREIRIGWEDAEVRATALERQVVYLRCSEEVLSAELGYSEELVSWWKQARKAWRYLVAARSPAPPPPSCALHLSQHLLSPVPAPNGRRSKRSSRRPGCRRICS